MIQLTHRLFRRGLTGALCLLALITLIGCSLPSQGTSVAVITGPPTITLASPLPNSTFLADVPVNILAAIANAGPDIQRVEVRVDNTTLADLNAPNPSGATVFTVTQTWTATGEGPHTISVQAFRGDGTSSTAAVVQINVVNEPPIVATETPIPTPVPPTATPTPVTPTVAATSGGGTTPQATDTTGSGGGNVTQPTATTQATTAQGVVVRVVPGGMNVRRGPSTNFIPPLGALPGEQEVPILATNQNGTWFKIRFNGQDAWISSDPNLVTVISGDVTTLPRETGPAIPTLPPPTAQPTTVPQTAAPGTTPTTGATGNGADLVITGFELRQGARPVNTIFINEPAVAFVKIKNQGNQPTSTGFLVILRIVNTADGGFKLEEAAAYSAVLAPGEETTVQIPFTDRAGAGLDKSAAAVVDENNQVPEANDGNNGSPFAINYVLGAQ
ncbi:MAG: SH3 domain-containing protein [Anaerolineae bacterium]|jgi:hypothetical protein|nr:SH3 domain-containing protein [Anaerolineae bacterium]